MRINDTDRRPYALADRPRTGLNVEGIRRGFPILTRRVHDHGDECCYVPGKYP